MNAEKTLSKYINVEKTLSKLKPVLIIILLFSVAFFLRVESTYLPSVSDDMKPLFEDQNGVPYFSEMDSYYNYRMTQDYLNNGHLGDIIVTGVPWDLHSYYPSGRYAVYPPLIVYITAFTYKLVNSFANVPLNAVATWLAPFIASLAVIPAYLFVRRITNDYGGITAGILVGTIPAYFTHTFAGFFDTDMFNMLFPILIVGFFIVSIVTKDIKNRSIFASLSAILLLIYSMGWEGWWYLFYLLVGTAVVYLLVSNYLFKMKTIKPFNEYSSKFKWFLDQPALFSLIVFAILSSILLSIYLGPSGFMSALTSSIGASQLHTAVQSSSYPNVYLTVKELEIPSLWAVILKVGGIIPFVFGILVVPLLLWKLKPEGTKKENTKNTNTPKRKGKPRRKAKQIRTKVNGEKIEKNNTVTDPQVLENNRNYLLYAILFSIWLLTMGFALKQGVRFVENFAVPIALGTGVFVGLMVPYFKDQIKSAKYGVLAILILIALISYAPVTEAQSLATSTQVLTGVDDSMYNSMLWIKGNTPKNTVLTSWWDFGHLFTAVADRPVTFDGGSQNTPRAYWVGRALTTSDENLSAGILRMLTSSGDQGIQTLEKYTHDTGKSVEILNKILPVDKQNAQSILTAQYNLTPDQVQNVLKYTHPDNPAPHELILSADMIKNAGVWSKFGNWNFQKNTGHGYGYSAQQASVSQVNGTTVIQAQNGIVAQISGTQTTANVHYNNQVLQPHKLIFVQNGNVVMNQLVSNGSSFSIALIQENNGYQAVLMNKELEDSLFTRLYFMNGAGSSKFKLVHKDNGVMVWNAG